MSIKLLVSFFFLVVLNQNIFAQEENYPQIIWCRNDSFKVSFSTTTDYFEFKVSEDSVYNVNTSASLNAYMKLYFGKDSIIFSYHNKLPNSHIKYFNLQSPLGKTKLRLRFNKVYSWFSDSYIKQHANQVQFDVPEVYELANIIWILSPVGQRASDLPRQTNYYKKVYKYFKPFLYHPLFKAFNFADSLYFDKYFDFRENSIVYNFEKNKLVARGPYYYVNGNNWDDMNSLFRQLLPLIEDFARKSNYRQFYKGNYKYYKQQIQRQKELMSVRTMWEWLEQRFPDNNYNSYRIIFSPLIGGSHSTQQFHSVSHGVWFKQAVMFVCGPELFQSRQSLTEEQKKGSMSGKVFTEIDHNYVNPVTSKYKKLVDSIFSVRKNWVMDNGEPDYYETPEAVFNEYMTHALFCLYASDMYDSETLTYIITERENLMSKRRFVKFSEFNKQLLFLYSQHKKMPELFSDILRWCKRF